MHRKQVQGIQLFHQYLHANSANGVYFVDHCGATATCQEHNFIIEEVKALPVTITKAKYATFYAPVAVKIPEGVYAWYLLEDGIDTDKGYASMTEITDRVIPAKTPVVIGSETTETTETIPTNSTTATQIKMMIDII